MLSFEGKEIETDNDGYLKDSSQWSEALAEVIAEKESITLSPEHWEVVRFVRDFYLEFNTSPAIRTTIRPRSPLKNRSFISAPFKTCWGAMRWETSRPRTNGCTW